MITSLGLGGRAGGKKVCMYVRRARRQHGCYESVARDCLVLGVCALVFELIFIFGGAWRGHAATLPRQALESDL